MAALAKGGYMRFKTLNLWLFVPTHASLTLILVRDLEAHRSWDSKLQQSTWLIDQITLSTLRGLSK